MDNSSITMEESKELKEFRKKLYDQFCKEDDGLGDYPSWLEEQGFQAVINIVEIKKDLGLSRFREKEFKSLLSELVHSEDVSFFASSIHNNIYNVSQDFEDWKERVLKAIGEKE